ncbi:hypothetical protein FDB61_15910 [Clostridium botulinum]|nr:hypothetical protein [Clostridium botulinum]
MKKFIKKLNFILVITLFFTMVKSQPAYADVNIKVNPTYAFTNEQSMKIHIDTQGVASYVRYTCTTDRPSIDQMWYMPAGHPNVQDWIGAGTTYLHIYIPSTGQWLMTGPYLKEFAPPIVPAFQNIPTGWVKDDVVYQIACRGDQGSSGYDDPNDRTSYYESGFHHNETWVNNAPVKLIEGELVSNVTVTSEGWKTEWARSVDLLGNASEWAKAEFGIDKTAPTIDANPTISADNGLNVNITGMKDHGLSGNKQLKFIEYREDNPSNTVTKIKPITVEGGNATQNFTKSDIGGYDNDTMYIVDVYTMDQVGNEQKVATLKIKGDDTDVDVNNPVPPSPDEPDTNEPIPEPGDISKLGKIKFNPNETKWTNKGKRREGEGKYPVEVFYDGDNPFKGKGVATIEKEKTDKDGNTKTVTSHKSIPVEFPLERIEVSNAVDDTVNGDRGTINIQQEGYHLHLHGEGFWGKPKYDEPEGCVDVKCKTPANPIGESKNYNVDWTKPEIEFNMDRKQIFSEANGAERKESILGKDDSFYGKLKVQDNLSGVKFIEYKWTYGKSNSSSGYTRIYESENTNTNRSDEIIEKEIEKPVGDDLWLHVRAGDVAGDNEGNDENIKERSFGPFEDPIKLLDFQVTDIRDPRWTSVFWDDDLYEKYKDVTYKANELPIDEASHPTLRNALPKKGYSFYFDITSEYLYRDADRIEIVPSYYYVDDKNNRVPVDLYYNKENNPLIMYGSAEDDLKLNLDTEKYGSVWIGGISKLTLTKGVRIVKGREWKEKGGWKDEIQYTDGKIQWWYGKYLIPATSIFVKQGDIPRPENIVQSDNVIINFQIVAYKNGIETLSSDQIFTYIPNQWKHEGGPKNNNYKPGDVILYDNKYSALSDYKAHVIQ